MVRFAVILVADVIRYSRLRSENKAAQVCGPNPGVIQCGAQT